MSGISKPWAGEASSVVAAGSSLQADGGPEPTNTPKNAYNCRSGEHHPPPSNILTEGLVRRGYSDEIIEAILGVNFKRVLTEIWPN